MAFLDTNGLSRLWQHIVYKLGSKADTTSLQDGSIVVAKATSSTSADSATTATKDASGNIITSTYETKTSASTKLSEAKTYADNAATAVKNDLLNGAGTAYDTLKELGDLIDDNTDAIDALETVAASKANASDLSSHTSNKSNPHGVTLAQLGVTATAAELNYLEGATSNIQTQLNAKAESSVLSNYYTKTEIDNLELITVGDIDSICGQSIQATSLTDDGVMF